MTITERWDTHPTHFWLRGEQPGELVVPDEANGIVHIYGYPEAQHILADPQTFSSHTGRLVPEADEFSAGSLVQLDPPRHTKLRKLVNQAFTPRVVAGLEPRITTVATELLDAADRKRIDLVAEFAYPLPVIVIAELLGVPASDRDLFHAWVDAMLSRSSSEFSLHRRDEKEEQEFQDSLRAVKEMGAYIAEHAASRRRRPHQDLLTRLVEAEVDGVRLTDQEVVNFANLLLIAGHITTTLLVGNTVMCLDAHSQERAEVLADRSLVPAAIEESLRVLTPFPVVARVTTVETEVAGRAIGADQLVMVWLGAANRDARQFPQPSVFDLHRDPNPHLAFGRGIHFCVGAPLARLEGKVATNLLFDRYPHLRSDPDDPPGFLPTPNMTGAERLPLLLS
jgi:cytochrome P450